MSAPAPCLTVVHLDDNPFELERVRDTLEAGGTSPAMRVHSLSEATALPSYLMRIKPDVVLLDLHLGGAAGSSGLDLVPTCRRLAPRAALVVLSASAEPVSVQNALTAAVDDYLSKETDPPALRRLLVETAQRARRKDALTGPAVAPRPLPDVAGVTMRTVQERIPGIVHSAISCVHVHGESGTGKEVVAELIRDAARSRPFLSVNCGAIAGSLLESTLFGVVKGSYTGASADRKGYLEAASGGWLFLDEVASLSAPAQAALLRAIENQEIFRVGASQSIKINVRLVTATHEDLRAQVKAGRFRLDLWQRLAEVEIHLPPLRERPAELHELIDHLVRALPGGPYNLTKAARAVLADLPWREGNVRQLRNCLRAMTERHLGRTLTPQAIPTHYLSRGADASEPAGKAADPPLPSNRALAVVPSPPPAGVRPYDFERLTATLFLEAVRALGASKGRLGVRQLAAELGLSKSSVSRKLWEAVDLGIASPEGLRGVVRMDLRRRRARVSPRPYPTGTTPD